MRPCKTSIMWKRRYVSGIKGGRVAITHVWMSMSRPPVWSVQSLHFHPWLYLWVRRRKERQSCLQALQPVSMNDFSRGNCPSLSSYLAEDFFLHHLMLNSSTFLRQFFSFYPSECLQIRFSCQAVSCWGLNDRGRCIIHQNYISWQWSRNRNKVFIGSGITRSNMWRGAVILRALLVWSLGNWWSLFF